MRSIGRFRYLDVEPQQPASRHRPRGTLVLLHAFPLSARMWEPQLAMAEEGWRVIAPDLRGFGQASSDPPSRTMDDYAADVIDLLDALHVHDAVVTGLSMGGYVAFALLRIVPGYVKGLILADTRAEADSKEGLAARDRMLSLVRENGVDAVADQMVPKLLGETTRGERPDTVDVVRRLILANSRAAVADAIEAMKARPDSTSLLARLHVPTLIVAGEEDTITPPSVAASMRAAIPGSEMSIVARAGHLSSLEAPEAFNRTLAQFLGHRV